MDIVLSAVTVDTITASFLLLTGRGGESIREWYTKFHTSAYLMDVSSLIACVALAKALFPENLGAQLVTTLLIQMAHDISFWQLLQRPTEFPILKFFKRYGDEMGVTVLAVDAAMVVSTLLLAHFIASGEQSSETYCKLGLTALFLYLGLLAVHSFN